MEAGRDEGRGEMPPLNPGRKAGPGQAGTYLSTFCPKRENFHLQTVAELRIKFRRLRLLLCNSFN